MKADLTRHYNGKPVQETDHLEGDGWCLELARAVKTRELVFVLYQGEGIKPFDLHTSNVWNEGARWHMKNPSDWPSVMPMAQQSL